MELIGYRPYEEGDEKDKEDYRVGLQALQAAVSAGRADMAPLDSHVCEHWPGMDWQGRPVCLILYNADGSKTWK
jgi:hypothetical protein